MSRCRSCGQPVEWAKFASGKRAPFDLDEQPTETGESRWILTAAGDGELEAVRARAGERGVTNHFATCPDADRWRKD